MKKIIITLSLIFIINFAYAQEIENKPVQVPYFFQVDHEFSPLKDNDLIETGNHNFIHIIDGEEAENECQVIYIQKEVEKTSTKKQEVEKQKEEKPEIQKTEVAVIEQKNEEQEETVTEEKTIEEVEKVDSEPEEKNEKQNEKEEPKKKKPSVVGERKRTKFAMGLNLSLMASNSYFKLSDFLKETLVIDFNKMNDKLPKSGYNINGYLFTDLFLEIYAGNLEFGISLNASSSGFQNMPKDIINFIANGNADNSNMKGYIYASGLTSIDQNIFFGMKIKNLSFRINASWYFPILYIDPYFGSYELVNSADGKVYVRGDLGITMYTPYPMLLGQKNAKFNTADIFNTSGFDIDLLGSYQFGSIAKLNFGILNIPIYPAKLNTGVSYKQTGDFELESLLEYLQAQFSNKALENSPTSHISNMTEDYNPPTKKIFRPIKVNVDSNIYPFQNEYLIITPSIGMHCLKPFYIDAGLKIESHFAKVLGAYMAMNREDRVWKHKLGLFVDARVFRLELAAALASPNFKKSFSGTGAQVDMTMLFGY